MVRESLVPVISLFAFCASARLNIPMSRCFELAETQTIGFRLSFTGKWENSRAVRVARR